MAVKQTAGRDALGGFASKFAELNDDVLFGQVWSREDKLSLRDRSIVTVVALMAQGLTDSSFQYHLQSAKNNGVTKAEIAEILTHAAFYAGWPKAWAAFRMAKEVWAEDEVADDAKAAHESQMVFPKVFHWAELPCAGFHGTGGHLQCDLRAGVPQQLAYPSCAKRRRADSDLRGRPWVLSGSRKACAGASSGGCGEYPGGCEALARRGTG